MDIKVGDMVRVSDSTDVCDLSPAKKLLGRTPEGGYITMSDDGSVPLSYNYAEKVDSGHQAQPSDVVLVRAVYEVSTDGGNTWQTAGVRV